VTLRGRFALLAAAAAAVTVAGVGAGAYLLVRASLYDEVDRTLRDQSIGLSFTAAVPGQPTAAQATAPPVGVITVEGFSDWLVAGNATTIVPDDAGSQAVRQGRKLEDLRTATISGRPYRVLTRRLGDGNVITSARPLDEPERLLARLRWVIALLVVAGGRS
jgi:hypothetical protein